MIGRSLLGHSTQPTPTTQCNTTYRGRRRTVQPTEQSATQHCPASLVLRCPLLQSAVPDPLLPPRCKWWTSHADWLTPIRVLACDSSFVCLCGRVGGGSSSRGDGTRYSPYPTAKRAAGSADSSGAAVGFVESLPVAPEGTDPLNVYVVDLPLTFTKEEFHALYEPFGSLVTSTVLTDPTSGQSRGIGFARYSNTDNAARALKETQGMMLPGASKPLLVRFARDSSRKHEEQTNTTLQRLHGQTPQQQPQQPMHPHHAAYSSSYTQPYPYAPPSYPAAPSYYPPYPPQLTSPAHRAPLPTPPPPPPPAAAALPQPPSSAAQPTSSSFSSARPNTAHSAAASNAPSPASAAVDSSSAASAAAYQQAWAAYYAQLGYPGYYTGYQYPAAAYPTPPYSYPTTTSPASAAPSAAAAPVSAVFLSPALLSPAVRSSASFTTVRQPAQCLSQWRRTHCSCTVSQACTLDCQLVLVFSSAAVGRAVQWRQSPAHRLSLALVAPLVELKTLVTIQHSGTMKQCSSCNRRISMSLATCLSNPVTRSNIPFCTALSPHHRSRMSSSCGATDAEYADVVNTGRQGTREKRSPLPLAGISWGSLREVEMDNQKISRQQAHSNKRRHKR